MLTKDNIRTFRQNLITLQQRMTELARSAVRKDELAARLRTDDLNWPFPQARLDELFDEFVTAR